MNDSSSMNDGNDSSSMNDGNDIVKWMMKKINNKYMKKVNISNKWKNNK